MRNKNFTLYIALRHMDTFLEISDVFAYGYTKDNEVFYYDKFILDAGLQRMYMNASNILYAGADYEPYLYLKGEREG